MVIFNDDVNNGRISIQTNYLTNRVNGKIHADWTENLSTCDEEDDKNYDPNFFDNWCANFYWCFRDYTHKCEPNGAVGITESQYKWALGLIAGIPVFIAYVIFGVIMIPTGVCWYIYDTNLTTCSFGILKDHETNADVTMYS